MQKQYGRNQSINQSKCSKESREINFAQLLNNQAPQPSAKPLLTTPSTDATDFGSPDTRYAAGQITSFLLQKNYYY